MTLKEQLEHYIASAGRHATDNALCCSLNVGQARKLLALLKAARGFHRRSSITVSDDDGFYAARDDLLKAIHAIEGA